MAVSIIRNISVKLLVSGNLNLVLGTAEIHTGHIIVILRRVGNWHAERGSFASAKSNDSLLGIIYDVNVIALAKLEPFIDRIVVIVRV